MKRSLLVAALGASLALGGLFMACGTSDPGSMATTPIEKVEPAATETETTAETAEASAEGAATGAAGAKRK